MLTPEVCVGIQETLGVDVAMALDECIEKEADRKRVIDSTRRTTRWLERCLAARKHPERTALFGIVQGGFHRDLRIEHARLLRDMDLDGYAIGGVSVGEGRERMLDMVETTTPELPVERVRYLMGVGTPLDILEAVLRGVDIFDCVLPTRTARFGYLFTRNGKLVLKHSRFKDDPRPIDPGNTCYTLRPFSRAYLRHLFKTGDVLAPRLLSLHNLDFYQRLMFDIRQAIADGPEALEALRREVARWEEPYSDPDDC
jgi:queuine tRNA-ribosyltransferase